MPTIPPPGDDRRGTLVALEPRIRAAFHPLYHEIARRRDLSAGAKIVYAVLCSYHQMFSDVFPGRERLGNDAGEPQRSLTRHLAELKAIGLLSVERRGLGMTNVYTLLAWPREWAKMADPSGRDGYSGKANMADPIHIEEEGLEKEAGQLQQEQETAAAALWSAALEQLRARGVTASNLGLLAELPVSLDQGALVVRCAVDVADRWGGYIRGVLDCPVRFTSR